MPGEITKENITSLSGQAENQSEEKRSKHYLARISQKHQFMNINIVYDLASDFFMRISKEPFTFN